MAYNYTSLNNFIEKVNKEAEKEAQKVYDKYKKELFKRVQNQIKENDVVWVGMGTATIENKVTNRENIGENLCILLGNIQYHTNNVRAGFYLPYSFDKYSILKEE